MNIVPEKMKLNKFQYTKVPENSQFYAKAMSVKLPNRGNEDIVADFTSRNLDKLPSAVAQSYEDYNAYVESLSKSSDTSVNEPIDAGDESDTTKS